MRRFTKRTRLVVLRRLVLLGCSLSGALALASPGGAAIPDLVEGNPTQLIAGHTYQASSFSPAIRIRILEDEWRGAQFTEGDARGVELLYLGEAGVEIVGGLVLVSKPAGSPRSVLAAIRATSGLKIGKSISGRIGPVRAS